MHHVSNAECLVCRCILVMSVLESNANLSVINEAPPVTSLLMFSDVMFRRTSGAAYYTLYSGVLDRKRFLIVL